MAIEFLLGVHGRRPRRSSIVRGPTSAEVERDQKAQQREKEMREQLRNYDRNQRDDEPWSED